MDISMALAGVAALAPALLLMYFVLKKYTYPKVEEPFFSDPSLFMLFAVGLVEGTILFVAYTYLRDWWGSIIVAVLIGAIMEIVKLVSLNLKRYNGKSDSIFYGFGLGIGMGAAIAFGMSYYITSIITKDGGAMDAASWIMIAVFILMYIFLNSATGTIIGEGIARYKPWEFFMQAVLVNVACQLLMIPTFTSLTSGTVGYYLSYLAMAASLGLAIFFFYRTVYKKLPLVVGDVLKSQGKKREMPR